jgi:putative permease
VIVLSAQLLFGALLGILGLALADPMVAMLKTGLEQKSKWTRRTPPRLRA